MTSAKAADQKVTLQKMPAAIQSEGIAFFVDPFFGCSLAIEVLIEDQFPLRLVI
jgi:hypothetical protein